MGEKNCTPGSVAFDNGVGGDEVSEPNRFRKILILTRIFLSPSPAVLLTRNTDDINHPFLNSYTNASLPLTE